MNAGIVAGLWRYPVKSMQGEKCDGVELTARGVRGDRLFAIRDGDGKLGSGKNTRRFRQIDGLLALRASGSSDWPEIVFPDGRRMRGDDSRINDALSDALGVPVTLAREDAISHFDDGPVHLVCTSALEWLSSRLPLSRIDERRFRPNITVETSGVERPELSWIGKTLRVGSSVKLRVDASTERCRMTTLEQADLPDDSRVLTCIGRESELQFGVYAKVLEPGRIAVGDSVDLSE